ncbi:MAG: sigma-70 family RNA polymerase sigma factor [Eubacteriales bacterium]|nr:sigma-70 family RNA polymerase sigma factor [Eubacteriales bacterium]
MKKEQFIQAARELETPLYYTARSILRNDEDCADAVQEGLMHAFEKLHTLKEDRYFKTWLTKIVIRECYDILRKQKKQVPYEDSMQEDAAWEPDRYSELYQAILELPEELRVSVTLYYLEGFSVKETAEILQVREGTVKSRLSRARGKLKECLDYSREVSVC